MPWVPAGAGSPREVGGADPLAWQRWWGFNHDPYLSLATLLDRRNRNSRDGNDNRAALEQEYLAVARPELAKFLVDGGPTPVVREALFALARIEEEKGFFPIDFAASARHFLGVDPVRLKGAAILTLGIRGQESETSLLLSLYFDQDEGRELYGRPVVEIHRAQAAVALGMVGAATENPAVRRRIAAGLLEGLHYPSLDVQVATLLALGRVPLEACDGNTEAELHLCRGVELDELTGVLMDEERHSWTRAHAAVSLGRLAAEYPDAAAREGAVQALAWALHPRTRVHDVVRQGAVLGLSAFADGDRDVADVEARRLLELVVTHGDPLSRRFALIGLGQCASRGDVHERARARAQRVLLGELTRGRKGRKPWAALALSALAFEGLNHGRGVDPDVTMALRESLRRTKSPADAGAFALSLAILRTEDPSSREAVRSRYERARTPELRELAAIVLGILGDQESRPVLRQELAAHPQLTIALRLLGDDDVTAEVAARLDPASENLAEQFALVDVLGQTASPDALAPLARLLANHEADPFLRARAARSIGTLMAGESLHWTAPYANGVAYDQLTWSLRSPWGDGMGLLDDR